MIRMMITAATLVFAVNSFASSAPAASAHGDADAGKGKVQACAACHGADGNSAAPSFPKLAGQNAKYLAKQLHDIKSGSRKVLEMTGQLDALNDQDMLDIAAYYEAQHVTVGFANPKLVKKGESVYRAGVAKKGVAACTACHSASGGGNSLAGFPALGGQHAAYISAQLRSFRTAAEEPEKGRTNDGESRMMRDVAASMSDLDIESVSSYIQGLH